MSASQSQNQMETRENSQQKPVPKHVIYKGNPSACSPTMQSSVGSRSFSADSLLFVLISFHSLQRYSKWWRGRLQTKTALLLVSGWQGPVYQNSRHPEGSDQESPVCVHTGAAFPLVVYGVDILDISMVCCDTERWAVEAFICSS